MLDTQAGFFEFRRKKQYNLDNIKPGQEVEVISVSDSGRKKAFKAIVRIDTPVEVKYYKNGGILQTVLREMLGD